MRKKYGNGFSLAARRQTRSSHTTKFTSLMQQGIQSVQIGTRAYIGVGENNSSRDPKPLMEQQLPYQCSRKTTLLFNLFAEYTPTFFFFFHFHFKFNLLYSRQQFCCGFLLLSANVQFKNNIKLGKQAQFSSELSSNFRSTGLGFVLLFIQLKVSLWKWRQMRKFQFKFLHANEECHKHTAGCYR